MRLRYLSLINFNYYLGWVLEGNSFDLKAFAEIVRTSRLSCNEMRFSFHCSYVYL